MSSIIQQVAQTGAVEKIIKELTSEQKLMLPYIWPLFAREEQVPKHNNWDIWIFLGGRGSGKTRAGAEWVREKVKQGYKRIAFVGRTAGDVRDIMVEGESGILSVCPQWDIDHKGHKMRTPYYEPSKRKLTWKNKAVAHMFTSKEPDMLRGPQFEVIWADELAAWIKMQETFDNAIFSLRLGSKPQMMITTTPRPLRLIKELVEDKFNYVTKSSSYRNKENLASAWFTKLIKRYEGTRLGQQELLAEILEDNPDALFQREDLEKNRIPSISLDDMTMTCTAVDPAATSSEESADTGIITAGKNIKDGIEHFYILDDSTCHEKPNGWAKQAIISYDYWQSNALIGEVNHGGEMIEAVIRGIKWRESDNHTNGDNVAYYGVRASKGKYIRAEPISMLSEQGRLHLVGSFPLLEDQMCQWSPNLNEKSPDRLDAMVWAVTYLMEQGEPSVTVL